MPKIEISVGIKNRFTTPDAAVLSVGALGLGLEWLTLRGYLHLPEQLAYFNDGAHTMADALLGVLGTSAGYLRFGKGSEYKSPFAKRSARRVAAAAAAGGLLLGGAASAIADTNVGRGILNQPAVTHMDTSKRVWDIADGAALAGVVGGVLMGTTYESAMQNSGVRVAELAEALTKNAAGEGGEPGEPDLPGLPGPDGGLPPESPEGFGGPEESPRPEN